MPTVKLIPSSYYVSSAYLTVANAENMYANCSSTSSGVITNTDESTSYYYFYLRGFNLSAIPANAVVESFTVRARGKTSGGYIANMFLCHGTTTISDAKATSFSTGTATRAFSNGDLTWADIVGYGSTFGIRINCRRNKKTTQATWTVYGAEIEVTYTEPAPVEEALYFKDNGAWTAAQKAYKKVGGLWVEQSDLTQVFDSGTDYIRGSTSGQEEIP